MLTPAKFSKDTNYLKHHLISNDYYCADDAMDGRWVGNFARKLGLAGGIFRNAAKSSGNSRRPNGKKRPTR